MIAILRTKSPLRRYGAYRPRSIDDVAEIATHPSRWECEWHFGIATADSGFGFSIFPAFTSRAFSFAIRFSNSDAGSSFGSCGTSLPRTARSRMKRRRRGIASGASAMRSIVCEQAFGVHRASASARIAFNWSRKLAVSASAAFRLCQQLLRVAVVVGHRVRVLDVEVVAARLHLLGRDLPAPAASPRGPCASRRPTSRCSLADARRGSAWSSSRLSGPRARGARRTRCPWSARPSRRTAGWCRCGRRA